MGNNRRPILWTWAIKGLPSIIFPKQKEPKIGVVNIVAPELWWSRKLRPQQLARGTTFAVIRLPRQTILMHECRYGLEFMQMSHSCQPTDLRCPVRSTSMSLQWMQCPFPRNQIQKSLRSLARSATNPPDATPGTHSTSESYGNFWARARSEITRSPPISPVQVDVSISCGRFQVVSLVHRFWKGEMETKIKARMKIRFIFDSSAAIKELSTQTDRRKALWENASAPLHFP